jgi:ribosome-associated protein
MNTNLLDFPLRSDFITLDKLLKACGLADSGGSAKTRISDGEVQVDGQIELRKTCKIRAGQTVVFNAATVRVIASKRVSE